MTNYGARSGTKGPGTAIITNDDAQLLDIPELVDDSKKDYGEIKDPRSY